MITKSKYGNKKTEYDNIIFDSKREKERYVELKALEKIGIIKDLKTQVSFELQPKYKIGNKTIRAIKYVCDFVYIKNEKYVVEDVKGFETEVFKIKRKMFEYVTKTELKIIK